MTTTPPLTCPVVSCHADTHALTEHLYDHSAGVLAHTLAGAAAEHARLEEVIAKRDTALAKARAENGRLRQQLDEAGERVARAIEQATVTVNGGTYPMQTAAAASEALAEAARIARTQPAT